MLKKARRYENYVVRLLKNGKYRDVVVDIEANQTKMPNCYDFYLSALTAIEEKAKPGETVIRVSLKGYS